jgi:hypothetical protein
MITDDIAVDHFDECMWRLPSEEVGWKTLPIILHVKHEWDAFHATKGVSRVGDLWRHGQGFRGRVLRLSKSTQVLDDEFDYLRGGEYTIVEFLELLIRAKGNLVAVAIYIGDADFVDGNAVQRLDA